MAIKTIEQKDLKWINIDAVNNDALKFLKENFKFHHLDLEDIQDESETPKIDIYKNYVFIVLQFPQWKSTNKTVGAQNLAIFVGDGYVITIQHSQSKEIKNFFYRCMKNRSVKRDWMSSSSGYLLYQIVESLFRNVQPVLNSIGKQISAIEHDIFEEDQDEQMVKELAVLRRSVLNFRRIIDPQRFLIANLSHTRKPFLNEETSLYFDDINDFLSKVWSIVDTYRETINGLHVTVESLINQRTNKVVSTLTVISVALLPLTLLSGIYGMNIITLPYSEDPRYVWGMFLGLAAIILLVIALMKKKKWL